MTKQEIEQVLALSLEYYKLEIFGTEKQNKPPTQERIEWIYERMNPSISSDVEEAAEKYAQENWVYQHHRRDGFIAGAEWQKEQFEKNRLAACEAQTKEEYDRETALVDKIVIGEHRMPTFSDAINYGINWQKQQMMKEAVEGQVTAIDTSRFIDIDQDQCDKRLAVCKDGDKVKLIILK